MVTVAIAPCTTSIFMMNRKNRISSVEQPKNPQKILLAKASRKVSRIMARVTARGLVLIDGPYEHLFERAVGAGHGFDVAVLGAQQIERAVCVVAAGEQKLAGAVLRSGSDGAGAQL